MSVPPDPVPTPETGPTAGPATPDPPTPPAPPARPGRTRRIALIAGGAVVAVLAGAYGVAYAVAGDRLPRDASVGGVPIGGLGSDAAVAKLTSELGPRTATVPVTVGGRAASLDAATAGLAVDWDATVTRAGGERSLDPRVLWRVMTGGSETAPVVTVDEAALTRAVDGLAQRSDHAPSNATIAYDTKSTRPAVRVRPAVDGLAVDRAAAADVLRDGFGVAGAPIVLPVTTTAAEITTAEVEKLAADYAKPAVSAAVVVEAGSAGRFSVTRRMIADSIVFSAADGAPVARLDAQRLRTAAAERAAEVELSEPRDATVRLKDGKPVVVPAVNGTRITADKLAAAVGPALTKSGAGRTVEVELTGKAAAFSTADAEQLGITRVTGRFTTYFPYAEYRNVNIGRAAEKINGTVLRPGQTFSLNKIVGERTRANGFVEGFIIRGSRFRKDLGGGVSQSATTTFNAMFFAGLKDVQHQPHGLYINRYPAGREATVAWPSLDLKFTNDTQYGVLVEAYVKRSRPGAQGSITVKMWSTKTWDEIRSSPLRRSAFTTGRDITDSGPDCEPTDPVQGFDVNYDRLFYRDGKLVKREPFRWRYAPTDKVVCRR